jgi:hypothetical protein
LARRIVDLELVVADDDGVALAAAQHRPGVVYVGVIVPVAQVPVQRLIFDVGVQALAVAEPALG